MQVKKTREQIEARFWARVKKTATCWEFQGTPTSSGYGMFYDGEKGVTAHRFSWMLAHGKIPKGKGYHGTCVLHRCDNPTCVNPVHLFLGTNADNIGDMVRKGRWGDRKFPEKSEHYMYQRGGLKLTKEQAIAIRSESGFLKDIAARYAVSISTISQIKTGKNWKYA